jgi:RNA polymerase sigma factor (sigma-70 family)
MDFQKELNGLRKQKQWAQQWVFGRYGKNMYALCRRYLSPAEDAEEAMMNGFLKIFISVAHSNFDNEAAFVGWMRRVMINECLQQLRKSKSFLVLVENNDANITDPIEADMPLNAKELFTIIEQLPTGYRTVFNLYVIEGYTHKEIAAMMQISEGASKSQLSKARTKLAELWKHKNEQYGLAKAR